MESVYAVHQDSHQFLLFSCWFYIVWIESVHQRSLAKGSIPDWVCIGKSYLNPRTFSFICNGRQSKCFKFWTRRGYESALGGKFISFCQRAYQQIVRNSNSCQCQFGLLFCGPHRQIYSYFDNFEPLQKKLTGAPFRSEMKIWHFLENHAGKKIFFVAELSKMSPFPKHVHCPQKENILLLKFSNCSHIPSSTTSKFS